jgi:hypothetical protein
MVLFHIKNPMIATNTAYVNSYVVARWLDAKPM